MIVLAYNMNIINWQMNDTEKIDTKTRKCLTMYGMHHPPESRRRWTLSTKKRERERTDTNRADLLDNNCWSRNIPERKEVQNDETGLTAQEEKEVVPSYSVAKEAATFREEQ